MKRIKYQVSTEFNIGTEENPQYKTFFANRHMFPVTSENIEAVKAVAYNGEYTIEDDGIELTVEQQIAELKAQLALTDYKAIKYAEGWITEEEYAPIRAERQALRDKINELEGGVS